MGSEGEEREEGEEEEEEVENMDTGRGGSDVGGSEAELLVRLLLVLLLSEGVVVGIVEVESGDGREERNEGAVEARGEEAESDGEEVEDGVEPGGSGAGREGFGRFAMDLTGTRSPENTVDETEAAGGRGGEGAEKDGETVGVSGAAEYGEEIGEGAA